MKALTTALHGVLLLQGALHHDERGFFTELFSRRDFRVATGLDIDFVQDNLSRSKRHVLRGLHYQVVEPQGKLIRVLHGEVYDVAVDLRRASPSFGRWAGFRLNAESAQALWLPPGFAHGFLTLSDSADCFYKTTTHYALQHERCLRWDDPSLKIDWKLDTSPIVAAKDHEGMYWDEIEMYP
ncbi:MAG: dTDP-4-dehydrorhamnose 3,5-epimerase [Betaproteobacteria bacterium]|jgi:dTDP-4-dehydrorhamnose 3,5-epimerase|nr:dTDP-4-dehydrorhamnose 3,5-epimerase [Betaproteobacteria bacterium]